MADLVAIGYPDETTAALAMNEAEHLAEDLIIQPDAVAAIVRDRTARSGHTPTTTRSRAARPGACSGGSCSGSSSSCRSSAWRSAPGMGALFGHLGKSTIDKQFQDQVRDMLKPGTSALFLVVEKVTPDKAVAALSKYGGTVLKTSLSDDQTEAELQDALHGSGSVVSANRERGDAQTQKALDAGGDGRRRCVHGRQARTEGTPARPNRTPVPTRPNSQQDAAPAPAAPQATPDMFEQLTKLGELRKQGVLTDAEFEVQKQKLLQAS